MSLKDGDILYLNTFVSSVFVLDVVIIISAVETNLDTSQLNSFVGLLTTHARLRAKVQTGILKIDRLLSTPIIFREI